MIALVGVRVEWGNRSLLPISGCGVYLTVCASKVCFSGRGSSEDNTLTVSSPEELGLRYVKPKKNNSFLFKMSVFPCVVRTGGLIAPLGTNSSFVFGKTPYTFCKVRAQILCWKGDNEAELLYIILSKVVFLMGKIAL